MLAETTATNGPQALALHLDVSAEPTEVRRARDFVRTQLAGYENAELDVIALLLSEVLTNAILHGGGSVEVDISVHELPAADLTGAPLPAPVISPAPVTAILVGVSDASLQLPKPRPPREVPISLMRENGLGLQIVRQLSDGWGTFRLASGSGKIVWFLVNVPVATVTDPPLPLLSGTLPPA